MLSSRRTGMLSTRPATIAAMTGAPSVNSSGGRGDTAGRVHSASSDTGRRCRQRRTRRFPATVLSGSTAAAPRGLAVPTAAAASRRRRGCPTRPRRCRAVAGTRESAAGPTRGRTGSRAGSRASGLPADRASPADAGKDEEIEEKRRKAHTAACHHVRKRRARAKSPIAMCTTWPRANRMAVTSMLPGTRCSRGARALRPGASCRLSPA